MLTELTVAAGEILWDLLETGPRLGGATTNFAVLSARLGNPTALITCLGDDPLGRQAIETLRTLGGHPALDLSSVAISSSLPTGTVAVSLDPEGRPHYEIASPVAWDEIPSAPRALALAAQASVFYFGTLAQRHELSRRSIRAQLATVPPTCIRVCDLNLRAPWVSAEVVRWSVAHADIVKISDEELPQVADLLGAPQIAFDLTGSSPAAALTEAAAASARAVLALAPHCRLVAITLGPHGSLLADRTGTFRHAGFLVTVVDTVGAGDAFMAGLIHAYTRTRSLQAISEVANRCGSFVASQNGATPELPHSLLENITATLTPQ